MGNAAGRHNVLSAAASGGSASAIVAALQQAPQVVHAPMNRHQQTMWHIAAERGYLNLLEALHQVMLESLACQHGGELAAQLAKRGGGHQGILRSLISAADIRGATPLMAAATSGQRECLGFLLSVGADPWQQVSW
jgi:ankyrin repeat protein